MFELQTRLSAKQDRSRATAIARALGKEEKTMTIGNESYGRSRQGAKSPLPSSISFGMTLVMAIACGVAAANIYYNQPMLGIMEAASGSCQQQPSSASPP